MSLQKRLGIENALFLIDGSAFIYRGFYANRQLQRSDGFATNALYSVARLLLRLLREEKPTRCVFFMDGRGTNFRHDIFPLYKANRDATPEELIKQFEPIQRLVKNLGITLEISDGCEADDCIASLTQRHADTCPIVIVGTDKDLRQCLGPNIWLWDPAGKQEKLISLENFTYETGLQPHQWPDVQALIGDSSDNIPGIPGIGPKTAQKIFAEFSSLEDIRDGLDRLAPKMQQKIAPHVNDMFLYRQLTTLRTDFCTHIHDDDLQLKALAPQELVTFFQEFELTSLQREVESMLRAGLLTAAHSQIDTPPPKTPIPSPSQTSHNAQSQQRLSLFDVAPHPEQSIPPPEKTSIRTLPSCKDTTVAIIMAPNYTGLRHETGYVLALHHATHTEDAHEWHVLHDSTAHDEDAQSLVQWLSEASAIITPDVKSLLHAHEAWHTLNPSLFFDLGLAAYLLSPEERDYGWARLLSQKRVALDLAPCPPAALALKMGARLTEKLEENALLPLYLTLEQPLIFVLAHMEHTGIAIDPAAFAAFLHDVQQELDTLTQNIYDAAGTTFNIRSAQQLGNILFSTLNLPSAGKTKGGQLSTSQERLEKLAGQHPVVDAVLAFRKLEKLRSTYLEPLPKLTDEHGRIHSQFNQWATATGRLSSSNPNLQNIPVRGELGSRMRTCFVAKRGHVLVSADYSQVELRVLAHMSQDPVLLNAFRHNHDIHASTAAIMYGIAQEDVTSDQRRNAKTINFGLIYGMGAQKLAQELGITSQEAKAFIEHYFKHLRQLKAFYEGVEEHAKKHGSVTTMAGRQRLLPDIHSKNGQYSALAKRQAINTVIQGSAADIIKKAMLHVAHDETLQRLHAALTLQVHDELVLEVPEAHAQEAGERMAYIMSTVHFQEALSVPLVVDWSYGKNWGEAH